MVSTQTRATASFTPYRPGSVVHTDFVLDGCLSGGVLVPDFVFFICSRLVFLVCTSCIVAGDEKHKQTKYLVPGTSLFESPSSFCCSCGDAS